MILGNLTYHYPWLVGKFQAKQSQKQRYVKLREVSKGEGLQHVDYGRPKKQLDYALVILSSHSYSSISISYMTWWMQTTSWCNCYCIILYLSNPETRCLPNLPLVFHDLSDWCKVPGPPKDSHTLSTLGSPQYHPSKGHVRFQPNLAEMNLTLRKCVISYHLQNGDRPKTEITI